MENTEADFFFLLCNDDKWFVYEVKFCRNYTGKLYSVSTQKTNIECTS